MPRPRKNPLPINGSDPETLVTDILFEVQSVLKEKGIAVPLSTWLEVQQAALALLPKATNNHEEARLQ